MTNTNIGKADNRGRKPSLAAAREKEKPAIGTYFKRYSDLNYGTVVSGMSIVNAQGGGPTYCVGVRLVIPYRAKKSLWQRD
jgi:hypothetical protein